MKSVKGTVFEKRKLNCIKMKSVKGTIFDKKRSNCVKIKSVKRTVFEDSTSVPLLLRGFVDPFYTFSSLQTFIIGTTCFDILAPEGKSL